MSARGSLVELGSLLVGAAVAAEADAGEGDSDAESVVSSALVSWLVCWSTGGVSAPPQATNHVYAKHAQTPPVHPRLMSDKLSADAVIGNIRRTRSERLASLGGLGRLDIMKNELGAWADELMTFWFGDLTDDTPLDREAEPFRVYMQRWYGKDPAIDQQIRDRFEPTLLSLTSSAESWSRAERAAGSDARAQLALTVLLDQLPRNMYRGTRRMYEHDGLALAHTYRSLSGAKSGGLTLLQRTFAIVPLMHAEDLTIQLIMEQHFIELSRDAKERSPHNHAFYEFSLDYARRHREIIQRFGRFPHRNAILERQNTPEEEKAMQEESLAF